MSIDTIDEIWKPVEGYERYHVSNIGKVKNVETGKMRKLSKNHSGYMRVGLSSYDGVSKNFYVHQLVAIAFIPNPDKLSQVDHIDRIRHNNDISNLRWASRKDQGKNRNVKKPTNTKHTRSIWMLEKTSGDKLQLFESIKLAAESIDPSQSKNMYQCIWNAANGRTSSYNGFKWCYAEDETIEGETWIQVHIGEGKKPLGYQISDHGRLKVTNGHIRVPHDNGSGYVDHFVDKISYRAHRLVALSFLDKPDGKDFVNHIDGNKFNCNLSNLEWVTTSENRRHAVDTGLHKTSPVYQYELSGEFIKKHQNATYASREVGLNNTDVHNAAKSGYTAGGFQWKLDNGGNDSPIPPVQDARFKNYVSQYTLDGEFVREFTNAREASRQLGICHSSIKEAASTPGRTAGCFQWRRRYSDTPVGTAGRDNRISQFTLGGEFVQEYLSAADAGRDHGVTHSNILTASTKSGLTAAGYQWRKKNSDIPVGDVYKKDYISQYTLSGEFVREFPTVTAAAKFMGADRMSIFHATREPGRTSAKYQWRKTRGNILVENLLAKKNSSRKRKRP